MTKNELDQTLRNSSNLPEDLRANREKANKNVGYLEHIKQSIISNRNVVNSKANFQICYIFIGDINCKKVGDLTVSICRWVIPHYLIPNYLFFYLAMTEASDLLQERVIFSVVLSIGETTKSLCILLNTFSIVNLFLVFDSLYAYLHINYLSIEWLFH